MATVNVEVKVEAPGLTSAQKHAEQLHNSLKGAAAAAATLRIPTPVRTAQAAMPNAAPTATDTNLSRGVAGVSGASGRDFAKQAQGLGGLVHVYATFAANLFAVSAAFGALSRAADTTNIIKGLDQLGAVSGRSLGGLAKQMVSAADGAISLRTAMSSTAMSTAAGMSSANILRMTEVAKKASLALGRDMPDSMDRLTKGIAKVQPELLDELGIMARVIPSQEAYARQLGKSVSALTDFEKKQAFANAVLEEGERKFSNIKIDANPYSQLLASMTNVAQTGLELVNKILTPFLNILSSSPTALTAAMAALGAVLLKQAIPAIGQFRENSRKMADENTARLKLQVQQQQDYAQTADKLVEDTARREFLTKSDSIDKIAKIQNMRFSKSVLGAEVRGLLTKSPFELTPEQSKKIEDQQGALFDKISKGTASKAESDNYNQLNNRLDSIRKISLAQIQAGAAAQAEAEHADTRFYAHQELRSKQLRKMRQEEAKSVVLSNASDNAATLGPSYAFTKLREQTSKLDAGPVSKFFTNVQGGAIIATSAIGNLLNVYGIYAALAVAVFGTIDHFLTSNAKEAEILSKSHDLLAGSLDTVDAVIKNLAANKDPLDYISTAASEAKANALKGLSDSLKQVFIDTKAAIAAMGTYDRLIDGIKSKFGKGIQDQAANDLAASISKAFKLASAGPLREAAAKEVKDLLKINIDPTNISAVKLTINADNVFELEPKLQAVLDKMSKGLLAVASAAKTLDDSFATASKSFDTVTSSLMPTDIVAKLGFDLAKVGLDFDEALKDPKTSIDQIAKTSKDISRLKLLDPVYAQDLLRSSKTINDMASSYATLTQEIDASVVKQAELSALIEKNQNERDARVRMTTRGETDKAKAELATLGKQMSIKIDAKFELQSKLEPFVKSFTDQQYAVMAKGADYVRASIEEAYEKSSISVSKGLAEAQSGTIGGIRENATLDKQAINLQRNMIDVNTALILATHDLTKIQEQILLEELSNKLDKLPADSLEYNKLEKDINFRLDVQLRDFTKMSLKAITEILKTGTPADKEAAKQALPVVQANAAANAKSSDLNAQIKVVDIRARYGEEDVRAAIAKDILATTATSFTIDKAKFDLQAKSAHYVSLELVNRQVANEYLTVTNKLEQDKLEYQNKITKLGIDQEETAKRTDITAEQRTKSLANIKRSITEINDSETRRLQRAKNEQDVRDVATFERRNKATKDAADFEQKLLDLKNASTNISANKAIASAEAELNLRKEMGSDNAQSLITRQANLAIDKETQRLLEATQGIQSAINLENADYSKRSEDILDKNSVEYKKIGELHKANIQKLDTSLGLEKSSSEEKIAQLNTQKSYNQQLQIQTELEAKQAKAAAIRANDLEVYAARLSLDNQRLDNLKELNHIDEMLYIRTKAQLELIKQESEYKEKVKNADDAILNARNNLKLADDTSVLKFGSKDGGKSQAQTTAQSELDLAESARSKIEATYGIEKLRTVEQKKHNLLLAEQKETLDKIADLTSSLEVIFGDLGKSIGDSVGAITKFGKEYADAQAKIDAAKALGDDDALAKANKAQTTSTINNLGLVAKATQGLYDKQTVGYKVLVGAEKAFSALKIGDAVKEFALKSGLLGMWQAASATANALLVAEAGITGTAQATASIPAVMMKFMAQMGPWGWAAAAAAIAALGLGVQGDSMVDMTGQTAADRQASQGTGTVTGDSTAKSNSISNSLAILNATSVEGLSYDNEMVNLLTSINTHISGVAKGIYGVVGLTSGTAFGTKEGSSGFNVLGGLFGSTTSKEITDTGIAIKGTFGQLIAGGKDLVTGYEDVLSTSTTSIIWISRTSQSLDRTVRELDPKLSAGISKIFNSAAGAFVEAGESLGMTAESVIAGLTDIDLSRIVSLRGLKGKELDEALSGVLGNMLDTAASVVFKDFEEFNKSGEGMFETAVRVSDGLNKVNLGLQSIGKSTVGSGIGGARISDWLIEAAGGLDKALGKIKNFGDKFLTDTERLASVQTGVDTELTRLGITGTVTRASFKKLVLGFEAVGPVTAKMQDDLLDLADGIDQVAKASEDAAKALDASRLDQQIKIYQYIDAEKAVTLTRQKELDALKDYERPGQIYINALEDEKNLKAKLTAAYNTESTAIKSTISSLKASIKTLSDYKTALTTGSMTVLDPTQVYNQTKDSFNKLTAIIKAPAVTDAEKLAQTEAVSKFATVSDAFLTASRVQFASSGQYLADFKSVTDFVDTSVEILGKQQTEAEQQLAALTASVNFLDQIKTATETTASLLLQLVTAQATTTAARLTYDTAVTATATQRATAATTSAAAAPLAITDIAGTIAKDVATTTAMDTAKATAAEAKRLKDIKDAEDIAAKKLSDYQTWYDSLTAIGGRDSAASGGIREGLTLVGEQGPEIVDFKTPSRVYSNPASNDLLSNADLISEIKNLHREIAQLRKDQREQTGYLIKSNYDANQLAAQQVADATEAAAATNAWNMRSAVKIA